MSQNTDTNDSPRNKFNRGQQVVAVITETDINGNANQALTRLESIVTFVDTAEYDLRVGDTVLLKIVDYDRRSIQALAQQKLSG